jgi:hypothetical protein
LPYLPGASQLRLEHANLPGSVLGRRRIGGGRPGLGGIRRPENTQPPNFRLQSCDSRLQVRVPIARGRGANCIPAQEGDDGGEDVIREGNAREQEPCPARQQPPRAAPYSPNYPVLLDSPCFCSVARKTET